MALMGWIFCLASLFGAVALRQDMPVGGSSTLSTMLILLGLLACPLLWRNKPFGISRGQRVAAAFILFFCAPILLLPTA